FFFFFFFSSRRRHTRSKRDWSSDVCSSDLEEIADPGFVRVEARAHVEPRRLGGDAQVQRPARGRRTVEEAHRVEQCARAEAGEEIGRASCRERGEGGGGGGGGEERRAGQGL